MAWTNGAPEAAGTFDRQRERAGFWARFPTLIEAALLRPFRRYSSCSRCRAPLSEYGEVGALEGFGRHSSYTVRCTACGYTGQEFPAMGPWMLL